MTTSGLPSTPITPLSQNLSRRAAIATGLKLAALSGTAAIGALALNMEYALPAKAAGMITNVTPGGTYISWAGSGPSGWYYVATGTDGRIFYLLNTVTNGNWVELTGNGRTPSAPSAAAVGSYVFVAVRGYDNNIYINQGTPGNPFVGWLTDGTFKTDVAPSLTSYGNKTFLFAKHLDGRIFFNWWALGGGGNGWQEVAGGGRTDATPVASVVNGYMFVAVKGLDGHIYINQGDLTNPGAVGWQTDAAFVTDAAPALASVSNYRNYTYLFAKGLDGYIYSNRWVLGGGGEGWLKVGDASLVTDVAPAAMADQSEDILPIIKGPGGVIYTTYMDINLSSPTTYWITVS